MPPDDCPFCGFDEPDVTVSVLLRQGPGLGGPSVTAALYRRRTTVRV